MLSSCFRGQPFQCRTIDATSCRHFFPGATSWCTCLTLLKWNPSLAGWVWLSNLQRRLVMVCHRGHNLCRHWFLETTYVVQASSLAFSHLQLLGRTCSSQAWSRLFACSLCLARLQTLPWSELSLAWSLVLSSCKHFGVQKFLIVLAMLIPFNRFI